MIFFVPVFILLLSPLLFYSYSRLGLRYGARWGTGVLFTVFVLFGLILAGWNTPVAITWDGWSQISSGIQSNTWLVIDHISWPFAFALTITTLSVLLTSLQRKPLLKWQEIAGILFVLALGLLGIYSGTFILLLLSWTSIDVLDLYVRLSRSVDRNDSEKIVISFFGKIVGVLLISFSISNGIDFINLAPDLILITLFAVGFRLGVFPLQPPMLSEEIEGRGLALVLRMAFMSSAFMIIARLGEVGVNSAYSEIILMLSALAGIYGALTWLSKDGMLRRLPAWTLTISSLAMMAVVWKMSALIISLGMGLMLAGSSLFLVTSFRKGFRWLFFICAWMLSGLAFTPLWPIAKPIEGDFFPWGLITAIIMAVLIAGYMRPYQPEDFADEAAPIASVNAIYVFGIVLLPVSFYLAGLLPIVSSASIRSGWWGGFVVVLLLVCGLYAGRYLRRIPRVALEKGLDILSFRWFYRGLWGAYRSVGRVLEILSRIIEGESAVLWALLLLAFLIVVFVQLQLGV